MAVSRIVVVGASAGGIEAVNTLVSLLPADFPAAICVVIHVGQDAPGLLASILGRRTTMPTAFAADGMRMEGGHIYVAPPAHHLLVEPGRLLLRRGPRENGFRPAIDLLFRSAAQVYGPNAVGVLMSGGLDDGTSGLQAIKRLGGIALVQDPREALVRAMPESAIRHVVVDCIATAAGLAPVLDEFARTPHHELQSLQVPSAPDIEVRIAQQRNPLEAWLGAEEPAATPRWCGDCRLHGRN